MKKSFTTQLSLLAIAIWEVSAIFFLGKSYMYSGVSTSFLTIINGATIFLFFNILLWNFQNKTTFSKKKIIFTTSLLALFVDLTLQAFDIKFFGYIVITLIIGIAIYWCLKQQPEYKNFSDRFISSVFTSLFTILLFAFWGSLATVISKGNFESLNDILNSFLLTLPDSYIKLIFHAPSIIFISFFIAFFVNYSNSNKDENTLDSDFLR